MIEKQVIFRDLRHFISILEELGQLRIIEGAAAPPAITAGL
jgi:hypothetical protein